MNDHTLHLATDELNDAINRRAGARQRMADLPVGDPGQIQAHIRVKLLDALVEALETKVSLAKAGP